MKIFKLKFFTLVLLLILLESCSSNEGLQEAAVKTADTQNSFVFDPAYDHYIIDGQLTTDHSQISNSVKDAWNVHYDGSKNRVVISSTLETFQVYKNSNKDLQDAMILADYNLKNGYNEITDVVGKATALPTGAPATYNTGFSNKTVVGYVFKVNNFGTITYSYNQFIPTSDTDLTKLNVYNMVINNNGGVISDYKFIESAFSNIFNPSSGTLDERIYINNESTTGSITKFFFNSTNYGGTSVYYTCAANSQQSYVGLLSFSPKSYY